MFVCIAIALVSVSFATAYVADLWSDVLDYWLIWAAIITGVLAIAFGLATVITQMIYVETLRTN